MKLLTCVYVGARTAQSIFTSTPLYGFVVWCFGSGTTLHRTYSVLWYKFQTWRGREPLSL